MMTSNNSPLLKGSQELTKTKGTIWKPLIAASLLPIFSFTAGQYLPYVIAAVSGSGAVAAVPLAIFAVSAVVALISTIYLIKLAASRADNKKEVGLDGEEPSHIASQEPHKFVCENCTNQESELIGENFDKPIKQDSGLQTEADSGTSPRESVPTPQSPPVTFGTQPSVSVLPPPPFPQGAVPPPPPPPSSGNNFPSRPATGADIFAEMKNKKLKETDALVGKSGSDDKHDGLCTEILSNARTPMTQEDADKLDAKIKEQRKQRLEEKSTNPNASQIALILARRLAIKPSDSESEHSDSISDSGWTTDESKDKQKEIEQKKKVLAKSRKKSTPSNSQSFHKERSESPDSGNVSGDDVHSKLTSPSPPEPKAEKPLISPKPVNLKTKSEAPPATTVTEVKNSSTRSVKGLTEMFNNLGD